MLDETMLDFVGNKVERIFTGNDSRIGSPRGKLAVYRTDISDPCKFPGASGHV